MKRVAVVGSGIAGLGCAYFLHSHMEITVFEKNGYVGGHTNTIDVEDGTGPKPMDTGFMVFNHQTYPNLLRLFNTLQVPTQATDMSFSVQNTLEHIEWNGAGYNTLFGQRRNLFRPRFWRFLLTLDRFNKEASTRLDEDDVAGMTLREYAARYGYGEDFLQWYLLPMGSAIWSTAPQRMLDFPARTLLRFFHNHGFLGMDTHYPWYTVTGGARTYVEKLIPPFADRIYRQSPVRHVAQVGQGVEVRTEDGAVHAFDGVILACHGDEVLPLLGDAASQQEREVLGPFVYEQNLATIHTDASVMPKRKRVWGAWNYKIHQGQDGTIKTSTHYWMNRLQGVSNRQNFWVTINGHEDIDPTQLIRTIEYTHPRFTLEAIANQPKLHELNRRTDRPIYFCGAYFKYGFHEDGFTSAVDLCGTLLGRDPWPH